MLADTHRKIHTRAPAPSANELSVLGQHLFDVAIGQAGWTAIEAAAAAEPIEIAFRFEPTDHRLARLPWEMLHDGARFLAERSPQVSVVRLTEGPEIEAIEMPLRVLFVVAASPSDGRILAGAEYLGILRRLAEKSGGLSHDLVVAATRQMVEDAVAKFRPSVIHVIGHGTSRAVLLRPDPATSQAGATDDPCDAAGLAKLFAAHPPSLVVLNICDAGRPIPMYCGPSGGKGMNLADGLVAQGVPIVLGMAGRVADHACRLYARRLYEAMAEGYGDASEYPLINIAQACARGRTAALNHAPGAAASVDWALPTVTVNESLADTRVKLSDKRVRSWMRAGQSLYGRTEPFCDRLSVLSDVGKWLRTGSDSSPVLAFVEELGAAPVDTAKALQMRWGIPLPKAQVGKTRLLLETAVLAANAGFLPCLLPQMGTEAPTTWKTLATGLLKALHETCDMFGHPWDRAATHTFKVLARLVNPQAPLSPEMEIEVIQEGGQITEAVICAAMQEDLSALSKSLKAAGKRDVVILLDGIHKWSPLVRNLGLFLRSSGVGKANASVPVVVSCSLVEHNEDLASLKTILGNSAVLQQSVRSFSKDRERDIAYRQFLLTHPKGRLVPHPQIEDSEVDKFLARLDDLTQGVPSWLAEDPLVQIVIDTLKNQELLIEANDAQILAAGGGK